MWKSNKEVSLVGILSATLLLNAAAACMWPLTTVYMHNELHQTLTLAGIAPVSYTHLTLPTICSV